MEIETVSNTITTLLQHGLISWLLYWEIIIICQKKRGTTDEK